MKKHGISWLNMPGFKGETWNPIVGCSKVSPGCEHCYAEKMANRITNMMDGPYDYVINSRGQWNGEVEFNDSAVDKMLKWKKPRMVFVNSMGDLFHENVDPDWLYMVFDAMSLSTDHIFCVLTKRPEIMRSYIQYSWLDRGNELLSNLWLGVTAESQEQADKRIPHLLATPAARRFVSVEPMLGPVDMSITSENAALCCPHCTPRLDWVICGCESGQDRRPMKWQWALDLRGQCYDSGTPFFMKQLEKKGRIKRELSDFPDVLQVRQWPEVPE